MRAAIDTCETASEDSVVLDSPPESSHAATIQIGTSPPVASADDITPIVSAARRLTPANQLLRFLETGALGAARPEHVPSRPAIPDICIASSCLLSCIDPMPLDQLSRHTVAAINAWPSADRSHILAVAHRDLRVARQKIVDLQLYVDNYAAHLSDYAGARDASIPLMMAETFPRLEGWRPSGIGRDRPRRIDCSFMIGHNIL